MKPADHDSSYCSYMLAAEQVSLLLRCTRRRALIRLATRFAGDSNGFRQVALMLVNLKLSTRLYVVILRQSQTIKAHVLFGNFQGRRLRTWNYRPVVKQESVTWPVIELSNCLMHFAMFHFATRLSYRQWFWCFCCRHAWRFRSVLLSQNPSSRCLSCIPITMVEQFAKNGKQLKENAACFNLASWVVSIEL